MVAYRILGFIGFIFSAIAAALGATIVGALYAFIPWIISIIIRGPSWILLSSGTEKKLYYVTGILVMILGLLSVAFSFGLFGVFRIQGPLTFQLAALLWGIYSFFEFLSYISIKLIFFRIASINIISIILMNFTVTYFSHPATIIKDPGGYFISIAFIIMVISAIFAAIGFFKFTAEKAKPEIKYTVPFPPY
jgi:MFS family permease